MGASVIRVFASDKCDLPTDHLVRNLHAVVGLLQVAFCGPFNDLDQCATSLKSADITTGAT
jgi:hypothetical protein